MTIIEVLQITLYFSGISALLALTFVLVRVFKALWPVLEMIAIYNKVKSILGMYSQIPDVIKDKIKSFVKK